jgi:hypothetical protein
MSKRRKIVDAARPYLNLKNSQGSNKDQEEIRIKSNYDLPDSIGMRTG